MLQFLVNESKQTSLPIIPPGYVQHYSMCKPYKTITCTCVKCFRSLAEAVQQLAGNVTEEIFTMVVRRSHLLEDSIHRAQSKYFSPCKTILVSMIFFV